MDMWGAAVLGGGGIVHVSADHTVNGGNTSFNTSDLYNNLIVGGTSFFWHLSDMVFDTVDGKFFVVDSDLGGGHNRIIEGNIADLLSNPGTAPTMTVLYSDPSTAVDASNRLDNLEVDVANNIVYFTHAGDLRKVNYDTANQAPTVLFRSDVNNAASPSGIGNPAGSTSNFFNDMVIDFATGHIYLSSTRVGAGASGDVVSKNFIYDLAGSPPAPGTDAVHVQRHNTGTARLLPFVDNDVTYDPIPGHQYRDQPIQHAGAIPISSRRSAARSTGSPSIRSTTSSISRPARSCSTMTAVRAPRRSIRRRRRLLRADQQRGRQHHRAVPAAGPEFGAPSPG